MSDTSHVFIVGTSRSGTSLLRNTLNASEELAITGETHFLGGVSSIRCLYEYYSAQGVSQPLSSEFAKTTRSSHSGLRDRIRRKGNLADHDTALAVADLIYARSDGFWENRKDSVEREKLVSGLQMANQSDSAVFDLLMSLYAGDKRIRGEKTPGHVFHVPTLLAWFPEARFVHIIRDLRAVYVSQQKKKMKQKGEKITRRHQLVRKNKRLHEYYVMANISAHWIRVMQLDRLYRERYSDRYLSLKYEDFVKDPESSLSGICSFAGVDYSPNMLRQVFVNSSLVGRHWDKHNPISVSSGIDPSAAVRWKEHLADVDDRFLKVLGKSYLRKLGYI